MKQFAKKIKWKRVIIIVAILAVVIIIGTVIVNSISSVNKALSAMQLGSSTTAKVEMKDIKSLLSSSGMVEPLNTYEVKTLVEGEVIAANFEEGDIVTEGQVLYQISSDKLDNKIENAETAVDRANKNYEKAVKNYEEAELDYQEALEDFQKASQRNGEPNLKSEKSGAVKTLFVKEGDKIQQGTQIAEIYDGETMLLVLPFNSAEVKQSLIGKKAEVTIADSFETIEGKVTKVSNLEETLSGNRLVKKVTIEVTNPGGLTDQTVAAASIGEIYSSSEGTFTVKNASIITATTAGEIKTLNIDEGSKVSKGDVILVLTEDSVKDNMDAYDKLLKSAKDALEMAEDSVEQAENAIEDAEASLEEIIESKTDYSITAPISGKVIRKDALLGDTINSNNSSLCMIYDLSALTFKMYVDELDVSNVKVGQEVSITADAFADTTIKGVVTNISLESTAKQGVTQYPVTVRINEIGDLLPGMNVTGEIILGIAEGVLAIPSGALMRGDVVYVADPTVTEAVGEVPIGFREVPVKTGITDGEYIEIISGLTGSEEVYVKRNTNIMMFPNMQGEGGQTEVYVETEGDGGY